jgi:integrase
MSGTAVRHHDVAEDRALPEPFSPGYFSDTVWEVFVPASGRKTRLDWAAILDDGTLLTAQKNSQLLEATKFALLLEAQGKGVSRACRGSTLVGHFVQYITLLRWMSTRDLRSFGKLSVAHAIGYRNHVQHRPLLQTGRRSKGDTSRRKVLKNRMTSRAQENWLTAVKRLMALQAHMGDLGTPFSEQERLELDAYLRIDVQTERATPRIPDETFRKLMGAAIDWIVIDAPRVSRLAAVFLAWREERRERKAWSSWRAYQEFASSRLPDETVSLDGESRHLSTITHSDFGRLMTLTRGACFAVIAGLVGMRASEILSLEVGCISAMPLANGLRVLELSGVLFKTAAHAAGMPAKWVAGYDEETNPVRAATRVLEQLPRTSGTSKLFASFYEQRVWNRQQVTASIIRLDINTFAEAAGAGDWAFSAHQFRKTFARFVALSSVSSVFALMRHFKHASILMTEQYLPTDPELLNDIFEASESLIAERLDSVYGASRLGGIAGKRIVANNLPYRGESNAGVRRRLVSATLRDPTAFFKLTPSGICIFEAKRARCEGDVENVGLDICVGCWNFAVHHDNLPAWIERVSLLTSAIEEQTAIGFVSIDLNRQLRQAEEVVGLITGRDGSPTKA